MAKTIDDYKKDYAAAAARGDAAGMKAANDGANAIRASQGQSQQYATSDINKVASGGTSGMVSNPGRYDSGGGSSGSSGGSSGGGSSGSYAPDRLIGQAVPSGGYTQKYNGGNAALDAELDKWSQRYNTAKASGDVIGMRFANDEANKVRNSYGYAAELANGDINNVKNAVNYYGTGSGSSGGTGSGSMGGSAAGGGAGADDMSNYLEEMYAAQRRNAIANLNSAYQQNVNAINRAGEGIDARYQNARNKAAGASELSARNFAEYAAASGLNSGAGGQAELARNVALQNNLNDISADEANVYAELELQRANAEAEYNAAIAQAEASNDFARAEALYQEKVRVQQALVEKELQQFQMDLQNRQFAFQQQQADIANQQWQKDFDYKESQNQINRLSENGWIFLKKGVMPSQEMLDAMGINAAYAQAYINNLSLMNSIGASGKSGGSPVKTTPVQAETATGTGWTAPERSDLLQAAIGGSNGSTGISGTMKNAILSGVNPVYGNLGQIGSSGIPSSVLNALAKLEDTGNAANKILTAISGYVNSGVLTEAQARELARRYGMEL